MISLRGPKLRVFAAVLAVVCLIGGIYVGFIQSKGFVRTEGTIVSIREEAGATEDETNYYPTVQYTVDGQTYTAELDTSSGSDKVGKTVTIQYNPNDPSEIHGSSGFGIVLMIISAALLVFVVVSAIMEKKSQKQVAELREKSGQTGYGPSVQGEERELYFLTDLGTPKYGHRLEDKDHKVLYEAKMTKFTMTQPFGFDFIDHEHNTTTPHLVGHSEESQWNSFLIDNHYTFELDGVDVWKHLKQNGISVDSTYHTGNETLLGTKYRILRDDQEIAVAESTSQYPHEEDAAKHKMAGKLSVQGFFRVWTKEENLDLLFVVLLAFARTQATDDKGGNFQTVVGTVRKGTEPKKAKTVKVKVKKQ